MLLLSPHQLGITNDGSVQWWSGAADCERPNFPPIVNIVEKRGDFVISLKRSSFIMRRRGALFSRTVGNRYPKLPFWCVVNLDLYNDFFRAFETFSFRAINLRDNTRFIKFSRRKWYECFTGYGGVFSIQCTHFYQNR